MLRDELMDSKYFTQSIGVLTKLINIGVGEVERKEIHKSQIKDYYSALFTLSLSRIFSTYSKGSGFDEVKKEYVESVNLMHDVFQYSGKLFSDYFGEKELLQVVSILSLAILLDVDEKLLKKIETVISPLSRKSKLVSYLLSYLTGNVSLTKNETRCEKSYKKINEMLGMTNEEIEESSLMEKYLKKWYQCENRVYLHETHETGLNNYVGYWSFESAAFVKMRGLDDSSFRDKSPFYPKDLV